MIIGFERITNHQKLMAWYVELTLDVAKKVDARLLVTNVDRSKPMIDGGNFRTTCRDIVESLVKIRDDTQNVAALLQGIKSDLNVRINVPMFWSKRRIQLLL